MASYGMLRRVALVRTDVSEEHNAFIIKVTRIGDLETLAVTSVGFSYLIDSCHSDDGGTTFFRNVSSYKSHTLKHPKKRHTS
jgi:hypothetical protein